VGRVETAATVRIAGSIWNTATGQMPCTLLSVGSVAEALDEIARIDFTGGGRRRTGGPPADR
jgi:hypothetical protein